MEQWHYWAYKHGTMEQWYYQACKYGGRDSGRITTCSMQSRSPRTAPHPCVLVARVLHIMAQDGNLPVAFPDRYATSMRYLLVFKGGLGIKDLLFRVWKGVQTRYGRGKNQTGRKKNEPKKTHKKANTSGVLDSRVHGMSPGTFLFLVLFFLVFGFVPF